MKSHRLIETEHNLFDFIVYRRKPEGRFTDHFLYREKNFQKLEQKYLKQNRKSKTFFNKKKY